MSLLHRSMIHHQEQICVFPPLDVRLSFDPIFEKTDTMSIQLQWPIDDIIAYAKRYAITHGLLSLVPDNLDYATIVPFSLYPSPYSYSHFQFIWSIQRDYNRLYQRVALDDETLEKALTPVLPLDDFVRRLWQIHRNTIQRQPIQLDIYRNDYMLDTKVNQMRQIEFNTISSAFAGLTALVANLHRAVLRYALNQCSIRDVHPDRHEENSSSTIDLILPNEALKKSAEAMIKAFDLYSNPRASIIFLIVPKERNVCDQQSLISAMENLRPTIRIHLKTFENLIDDLIYDETTHNISLRSTNEEIALVYFRAAYIPEHYVNEQCWKVRQIIEQSRAIKCPTIRSQLAGCKIVQEYLSRDGIVEKYLDDRNVSSKIRSTFASMFTFDDLSKRDELIEHLRLNPEKYVLKPQREGGGNNKYDDELFDLITNHRDLLNNFIAMEKILPPRCRTCLIKPNDKHLLHVQCINEIGIYGTMLTNVQTNEEYLNEVTGYLVRTKTIETNEGGVATGYSVLDCLNVAEDREFLTRIFAGENEQ